MKKFLLSALILGAVTACRTDDSTAIQDSATPEQEFRHLSVVVNDEVSTDLHVLTPAKDLNEKMTAQLPKTSLYTTESGRFAIAASSAGNLVRFFDSGVSVHGDHTHQVGNRGWTSLTGEFQKPSHVYTHNGEIAVFNDGLGKMSWTMESQLNDPAGKFTTINHAGATPHHGAMVRYSNGNYAITLEDNAVEGASSSLPERVKVIGRNGETISESSVATKGIHGDEGDGENALFGSYSGVLVVNRNGQQRLIAYPADFGATDILGTLYYSSLSKKFYGRHSKKGLYEIDLASNTIKPAYLNAEISSVEMDLSGRRLVVLHLNGGVKLYNTLNGNIEKEIQAVNAFAAADASKPYAKASERFVYVTEPRSSELLQISIKSGAKKAFKVSAKPYRLALIGAELDN